MGEGGTKKTYQLSANRRVRSYPLDPFGNVYYTETAAGLIRKIAPNGVITNFAGFVSGTACPAPAATSAINTGCSPAGGFGSLNAPIGVAVDSSGAVWTANSGSNMLSKFIGIAAPVITPLAANVGP